MILFSGDGKTFGLRGCSRLPPPWSRFRVLPPSAVSNAAQLTGSRPCPTGGRGNAAGWRHAADVASRSQVGEKVWFVFSLVGRLPLPPVAVQAASRLGSATLLYTLVLRSWGNADLLDGERGSFFFFSFMPPRFFFFFRFGSLLPRQLFV